MLKDLQKKVPAVEKLEENFSFVSNPTLRANIAIAFQYVIFGLQISSQVEGPLCYSTYKMIIVYTSSIVESLIHFCLRELIDHSVVESSDVMGSEWKLVQISELYSINESEYIVGAKKNRASERLTDRTIFASLNKAAKRAGIFDEQLFLKAEELRTVRNKIHLAGLEGIDDLYSKNDVDRFFNIAAEIRQAIENKLNEIND